MDGSVLPIIFFAKHERHHRLGTKEKKTVSPKFESFGDYIPTTPLA